MRIERDRLIEISNDLRAKINRYEKDFEISKLKKALPIEEPIQKELVYGEDKSKQ